MNSDDLLAPPANAAAARSGRLRFSVAQFLAALVLLIASSAYLGGLEHGPAIEDALFSMVMVTGALAIGAGRRTLAWASVLAVPALLGQWSDGTWMAKFALGQGELPLLLFLLFVALHLLRFILRAPHVNSEVLCAGIATYLMLGLIWAVAYVLTARLAPDSFAYTPAAGGGQAMAGFNAVYFSFITLSTAGYGDFVPVSPTARMLAMTEAMTGTLYLAILISRLVSLHVSANPPRQRG